MGGMTSAWGGGRESSDKNKMPAPHSRFVTAMRALVKWISQENDSLFLEFGAMGAVIIRVMHEQGLQLIELACHSQFARLLKNNNAHTRQIFSRFSSRRGTSD